MSLGRAVLLTAALAAVALPARPGRAADAFEKRAAELEGRLALVEATQAGPDDGPEVRARRMYSDGETQYLLGDWRNAAILLYGAVSEPAFRASPDLPRAWFYLADALRRQGACAAAAEAYREALASGGEHRAEAVAGALECAVELRDLDAVPGLLELGRGAWGDRPPPEVPYLSAKALWFRRDLRPAQRLEQGLPAFAAVPPPYHLQAAYFQGALLVQAGDLDAAAVKFEDCGRMPPADARGQEVRELCFLALGRVYGEQGKAAEALDRYQEVPIGSPRFEEALFEIAWTFVRAGKLEEGLRTASIISDLSPESPLAPEATVLQGHLLLKLGRYADATEAYNEVINAYGPVRDEIDAILTMHEDPVRYFDDLIGRQGQAFDVAQVLPPVAVRWASSRRDVSAALDLVAGLDANRRELDEAGRLAARLEDALSRGGGLDAFPLLRTAYANAQAVENGAARLAGDAASAAVATGRKALDGADLAALDEVHARRRALEERIAGLPRSADEVEARLARLTGRLDALDREAFQLGYVVQAGHAAIAGAETWLERHRAELAADAEGRAELAEELRKQRDTLGEYEARLRDLRDEIARARDGAAGAEALAAEARLRAEYLGLLARERDLLERARPRLSGGDLAELERAGAAMDRAAAIEARAGELSRRLAGEARRRAGELRARVDAERADLAGQVAALDGVREEARGLVGRIAFRSFGEVRAQFYRIVLKADVGIVDVAWTRKRERLDRIQQLSVSKATELEQLERDFRGILGEVVE